MNELLSTQDIQTLMACSAVSRHFHAFIHSTVQLKPHSLLRSWTHAASRPVPAKQRQGHQHKLTGLLWLCKAAGAKFVNTFQVACNLLKLLKVASQLGTEKIVDTLRQAGKGHTALEG